LLSDARYCIHAGRGCQAQWSAPENYIDKGENLLYLFTIKERFALTKVSLKASAPEIPDNPKFN
jgi:hypothetical protein